MPKKKILAACAATVVVILAIVILIVNSVTEIQSHEVGLKYNSIQKSLDKEVYYEGLHLGPPGFKFIKYSAVFRTMQLHRFSCLNKDEVAVVLELSFQYRIRITSLFEVTQLFKDQDGHDSILKSVAHSAIHEACSKFNTSQFQTERGSFQIAVKEILIERLGHVFTDIADLQMQNIQRPYKYEVVVQDKETAREDIDVAEQERPKLKTIAMNKLKEAKNGAEITIQTAKSNARVAISKATAKANGIKTQYEMEAKAYRELRKSLDFSAKDLIRYIATRAIFSERDTPVDLAIDQPAELSLS